MLDTSNYSNALKEQSAMYLQNKYATWYYSIIEKSKLRILPKSTYVEKHHIVPRCLGGNNLKENIATLTAREHFVCHYLLTKMTSGNIRHKMLSAVTRFQQQGPYQKRVLTSWEYQKLRECANAARKGIRHTQEAIQKIIDNHHDVSGSNNPRARHIKATSPDGIEYKLVGCLKIFCKQHKLAYSSVFRILSVHDKWKRSFKGSTEGWSFAHLD